MMSGRWWLVLVIALWAASLILPALRVGQGAPFHGLDLLFKGWRGLLHGVVAWYANPLLWLALAAGCTRRYRAAAVLSGVALLLALSSAATTAVLAFQFETVPGLSLLAGFYVWLAAYALLFAWSSAWLLCFRLNLPGFHPY